MLCYVTAMLTGRAKFMVVGRLWSRVGVYDVIVKLENATKAIQKVIKSNGVI